MGTWAHRSFDNDDAMDFADELCGAEIVEPIVIALRAVIRVGDDYLEAPKAVKGLAAAEVMAALLGKPAAKLPEEVIQWVKNRKAPDEELARKARQVVTRILRDSELKDLWGESADLGLLWQEDAENLLRRLVARQPNQT
jgi:hypothetical protein